MTTEIAVMEVRAQSAAVARGQAKWDNIPPVLIGLMNLAGHHGEGLQVAIYYPMPDGPMIEAGVLVPKPFEDHDSVFCSATPEGLAAVTSYTGPYRGIPPVHRAIHKWAKDHGHTLAGPNWEIYSHWDEDENKLRTDIYYLLK